MQIWLVALESGKMTTENHTNSNFTWQVRVAVHTACNAVVHDFENRGEARIHYKKKAAAARPGKGIRTKKSLLSYNKDRILLWMLDLQR